jgi:hypothetical protein
MSNKKTFTVEFEDLGPSTISYKVTGPPLEKITTTIEDQVPVLYANKGACSVLAEIFAKLAMGSHPKGFHVHLHENLDVDQKEILRVILAFD